MTTPFGFGGRIDGRSFPAEEGLIRMRPSGRGRVTGTVSERTGPVRQARALREEAAFRMLRLVDAIGTPPFRRVAMDVTVAVYPGFGRTATARAPASYFSFFSASSIHASGPPFT